MISKEDDRKREDDRKLRREVEVSGNVCAAPGPLGTFQNGAIFLLNIFAQ